MKLKLLMASLLFSATASAIPAKSYWRTLTLDDGTKVEAKLVGDEHFHYYVTRDGRQMRMAGGRLKAVTPGEMATLRQRGSQLTAEANARRAARAQAGARRNTVYTGSKRCLVILAQFPDVSFTMDDPKSYYNSLCNDADYQGPYGTTGSMHDYFTSQSYGQFDLQFDVVGPVTLPQNSTWYGAALEYNGRDYNDGRAGRMILAAVKGAAAAEDIDFTQYDWDDDGEVDQVYVVYAGKGAATDDDDNLIWPHESSLDGVMWMDYAMQVDSVIASGKTLSVIEQNRIYYDVLAQYTLQYDGKRINTYACGNEYTAAYAAYGYPMIYMGLGVMAHEFSHCLGLPDMYDTGASSSGSSEAYTTGTWDLMAVGSYNGPRSMGWCPANYNAYERNFCGWLELKELADNDSIKAMQPIDVSPEAYVIYNPADRNEYYTLENRSRTGWDAYTANSGLLIHHVDYDAKSWRENTVNASDNEEGHPHFVIVPADNSLSVASESGDTYPRSRRDSLTDYGSGVRDRLWNANTDGTKYLHARIVNIRKGSDGTVSFNYNPSAPVVDAIKSVAASGRKVMAVYSLSGVRIPSGEVAKGEICIVRYDDGTVEKVLVP